MDCVHMCFLERDGVVTTYLPDPIATISWIIGQRFQIGPRVVFEEQL